MMVIQYTSEERSENYGDQGMVAESRVPRPFQSQSHLIHFSFNYPAAMTLHLSFFHLIATVRHLLPWNLYPAAGTDQSL